MQFAPTYHDYVLYNHSEGEEGSKKYRARTFVPTGIEMDSVRRNQHMFGNKLEDVQLPSVSSSGSSSPQNTDAAAMDTAKTETINSSFIIDASNTDSLPYDLSDIDIELSNYPAKVPAATETGVR